MLYALCLFVVDDMQLDSFLTPPVVPSRAEQQPLRQGRGLIRLQEIEAYARHAGFVLPHPQAQMAPLYYLRILHLEILTAKERLRIAHTIGLHSFEVGH
jgi:hypothetical protein